MATQSTQPDTEFSSLTQVSVNIQFPSATWHSISQPQAPTWALIGQLCARLRKLGINNARILYIYYPNQQLRRFNIALKHDFNPCGGKNWISKTTLDQINQHHFLEPAAIFRRNSSQPSSSREE
ncbi:hypothetical protein G6F43_010513 [Rhizopus delemar]|nr:hypothetical protein G6F43_010513 [Rhizopus delemar]